MTFLRIKNLFSLGSFVFLLSLSLFAQAHVLKNSSSELTITGQKAQWIVSVHEGDYHSRFQDIPENIVKNYVARQLKLQRGGEFCSVASVDLKKQAQRITFMLNFSCESFSGDLKIYYDLFYGDWNHRHLAQIHWNGQSASHVFSPSQTEWNFSGPSTWQAIATFLKLGFEHILEGYDHILFLFTLLLGARRFSHLLGLVTAFTLAHSLSLALATLDWVNLSPQIVEPGIAASIVILAFLDFRTPTSQETHGMLLLTFFFGLIHGLGFSTILKESGIHGKNMLLPLFSFNGGVELGQILIVGILYPLLWLAQKKLPKFYPLGRKVSLALIGGVGLYWFVTRLF